MQSVTIRLEDDEYRRLTAGLAFIGQVSARLNPYSLELPESRLQEIRRLFPAEQPEACVTLSSLDLADVCRVVLILEGLVDDHPHGVIEAAYLALSEKLEAAYQAMKAGSTGLLRLN